MAARPRKTIDTSTYEGRFAARLKELRERAKLSPEQVAEALGVSVVAIYHWEAANRTPPLGAFPKFARLYKLKKIGDILPKE